MHAALKKIEDGLRAVPLGDIIPHPKNPRKSIAGAPLDQLAASLKAMGQLQPGVARTHPEHPEKFQLLCGHRRFVALGAAGIPEMLLIIREVDETESLKILVTENLHREDLTPMEEAHGVKLLLEVGREHQGIADDLGKSLSWVYKRAKLTELHPDFQKMVENPDSVLATVSAEYLEELAVFPQDVQAEWANRGEDFRNAPWCWSHNLAEARSVGQLRKWIADRTRLLKKAQWSLDDEMLVPTAGSCRNCTKRSGCNPDLFEISPDQIGKQDRCLDGKCWAGKVAAHGQKKIDEAKQDKPGIRLLFTSYVERKPSNALAKTDCELVKKGTPGAEEAVIIDGEDMGRRVWITGKAYNDGKLPEEKKPTTEIMKEGTPAQKKELLEQKRVALVNRRVAVAVGKVSERITADHGVLLASLGLDQVAILAVMFGAPFTGMYDHDWWMNRDWPKGFKVLGADLAEACLALSGMVAQAIQPKLVIYKTTEVGDDVVAIAKFLCSLEPLDLNWKSLLSEAEAELPEPRGWAALEAAAKAKKPKAAKSTAAAGDSLGDALDKAEKKAKRTSGFSPEEWDALTPEQRSAAINGDFTDMVKTDPMIAGPAGKKKAKAKGKGKKGGAK